MSRYIDRFLIIPERDKEWLGDIFTAEYIEEYNNDVLATFKGLNLPGSIPSEIYNMQISKITQDNWGQDPKGYCIVKDLEEYWLHDLWPELMKNTPHLTLYNAIMHHFKYEYIGEKYSLVFSELPDELRKYIPLIKNAVEKNQFTEHSATEYITNCGTVFPKVAVKGGLDIIRFERKNMLLRAD